MAEGLAAAKNDTVGIPRIIHRYWAGHSCPSFVQEFEQQWRELHPNWQIETWRDEHLPSGVVEWLDAGAGAVVEPDSTRHRSNMARYWLLASFGGVWVDCDVRPLRPIDDALGNEPFVASLSGRPCGAVMGGPRNHSFFHDLVESLVVSRARSSSVQVSGMEHLRRVLVRHDVRVCPPSMFFTYTASGRPLYGDAYTEHLWASSRVHWQIDLEVAQ